MKVFIVADIEGVAGLVSVDQCGPGRPGYPVAQRLMTEEANAAIEGAYDGGATSVTLADGHAQFTNVLQEALDPRATLVTGRPRGPLAALRCLDEECDVLFFVGYHAAAGVGGAVRAHTVSGATLYDVRVDGKSVSETELHGLVAAEHGVPIGLATGDDAFCELAARIFPGVRTVAVKVALGVAAARSLHPVVARDLIREAAREVVQAAPPRLSKAEPGPHELEVDLHYLEMAEVCELLPGAERSGRTVRITARDATEVLGCVEAFVHLAQAAPGPGQR